MYHEPSHDRRELALFLFFLRPHAIASPARCSAQGSRLSSQTQTDRADAHADPLPPVSTNIESHTANNSQLVHLNTRGPRRTPTSDRTGAHTCTNARTRTHAHTHAHTHTRTRPRLTRMHTRLPCHILGLIAAPGHSHSRGGVAEPYKRVAAPSAHERVVFERHAHDARHVPGAPPDARQPWQCSSSHRYSSPALGSMIALAQRDAAARPCCMTTACSSAKRSPLLIRRRWPTMTEAALASLL